MADTRRVVKNLMTNRAIIVVKAEAAEVANARAKEVDAAGGERTFSVGLSATGKAPATHFWCSWQLPDGDYDVLCQKLQPVVNDNGAQIFNGNRTTPDEVLATLGLTRLEDAP